LKHDRANRAEPEA